MRARVLGISILVVLAGCAQLMGIRDGELDDEPSGPGARADASPSGDATSADVIAEGPLVRTIAAGGAHTCALYDDGRLRCWGDNRFGQLGLGDLLSRGKTIESMSRTFVDLGASWATAFVALGRMQSCAVSTGTGPDARLKCWGRLGPDTDVDGGVLDDSADPPTAALAPVLAVGAKAVGAGVRHTCAAIVAGVVCWGATGRPPDPRVVGAIAAGSNSTCELFARDKAVRCWESGTSDIDTGAVTFAGDASVEAIAGRLSHACARLSDGSVACWGNNFTGQLAPGIVGDGGGLVDPLSFEEPVREVTTGARHTCVLLERGTVKCWGDNADGQLGLVDVSSTKGGPFTAASLPAVDLGGARAIGVAAGDAHTCVLLEDHAVKCWGSNQYGQLGLGQEIDRTVGVGPRDLPNAAL